MDDDTYNVWIAARMRAACRVIRLRTDDIDQYIDALDYMRWLTGTMPIMP